MYQITKEFDFCAAHRIEGHPKCGRLHGHNYHVTVSMSNESLEQGMILDYGLLKQIVDPIMKALDHRYLVSDSNVDAHDPYAELAKSRDEAFRLPTEASTAECIARYLTYVIDAQLREYGAVKVVVSETPKTSASFEVKHG